MRLLPKLAVTPSCSRLRVPRLGGDNVEVWRDAHGTVCAYGYSRRGKLCMLFPGLAEFRFTPAATVVEAIAAPGAPLEIVRDTCRRSALPMALQTRGLEVLHASAVRTPRGIVALCGESGAGKSTIAFALSRRGFPLWADDSVALNISVSACRTVPAPFRIRLRPESATYFQAKSGRSRTAHLPVPLTAAFILCRGTGRNTVTRLSPHEAFSGLLAHAYCFNLRNLERKRRMIENYLRLSAMTPVFKVRFESGLHHLPVVLDIIELDLERLCAQCASS